MKELVLQRVKYLPNKLESGILYLSEQFKVAGHLCACGCGTKVITPLGDGEWSFSTSRGKPTLYPSIGNWQLPCRSHYWIANGTIDWSFQWTDEEIQKGYKAEEEWRIKYFEERSKRKKSVFKRIIEWVIKSLSKFGN